MAHSSLIRHRKLKPLATALGVSEACAAGHLEFLWQGAYADRNVIDGTLVGWSADDIAGMAGWDGDAAGRLAAIPPDAFVAALVRARFLDTAGDQCWRIHDYLDWAPRYVHQRIKRHLANASENGAAAQENAQGRVGKGRVGKGKALQKRGACTHSDRVCTNSGKKTALTAQAKAIYSAYPRHVGPARACTAIEKALVRLAPVHAEPYTWLLGRVQKFATSPAGQQGKYTPYPATWFNQERYDDDDDEWQRTAQTDSGSSRPERGGHRAEARRRQYPGAPDDAVPRL